MFTAPSTVFDRKCIGFTKTVTRNVSIPIIDWGWKSCRYIRSSIITIVQWQRHEFTVTTEIIGVRELLEQGYDLRITYRNRMSRRTGHRRTSTGP